MITAHVNDRTGLAAVTLDPSIIDTHHDRHRRVDGSQPDLHPSYAACAGVRRWRGRVRRSSRACSSIVALSTSTWTSATRSRARTKGGSGWKGVARSSTSNLTARSRCSRCATPLRIPPSMPRPSPRTAEHRFVLSTVRPASSRRIRAHAHCEWTVTIDPSHDPVADHPLLAGCEQSALAGVEIRRPAADPDDDGLPLYDGPGVGRAAPRTLLSRRFGRHLQGGRRPGAPSGPLVGSLAGRCGRQPRRPRRSSRPR